jgi:hypothetical protein
LEIRIVWPALLSTTGAVILSEYSIAALVLLRLAEPVLGPPVGFSVFLPYVSIGLSGLVGLGFSIALLLDRARRRLWGILVLASCGVASYFLIQFWIFIYLDWLILGFFGVYALAGALFLGATGAIWGILWKPQESSSELRESSVRT